MEDKMGQMMKLKVQLDTVQKENQDLSNQLTEEKAQVGSYKADIENLTAKLALSDQKIVDLQVECEDRVKLTRELQLMTEQFNSSEQQVEKLVNQINQN